MTTSRDVQSLADAIDRARPEVTETDHHVTTALYKLLGRGRPVAPAELAAATELAESEIEARLEKWPGVYRDQQGRVVGFWGLTVLEMPPHEIFLDGRKLWAWCAWDTLFLPAGSERRWMFTPSVRFELGRLTDDDLLGGVES